MTDTIRALDDAALAVARSLLEAAALPVDDLDDPSIELFGAFDGNALVGVIGLQSCDDVGLLRSLAVGSRHRDRGIAHRLCDHVLARARERRMPSLWLLATTARDYFERHAFEVVPRDAAPAGIRATEQFSSLCPSSAYVMRRVL